LRDASLGASKFQDFPEERAAPRRRGPALAADPAPAPGRAPKKKRSVLARVFAPHRMGMLVLLGIGGLAFVGVPMNALFLQDGHHPAPLFSAHAPAPLKAEVADAPEPASRPARAEAARVETDVARPEAAKAEIAPPVAAKPSKSDAAALKAMLAKPEGAAAKPEKKRETASRDPISAMLGGGEAPARPKPQPKIQPQAPAPKPQAAKPQAQTQAPKPQAAKPQVQTQAPKAQASGEDVASAQRALQRLGYVVKPDGVVSAGTKQAIEKFERDNGLPAKGELNARIAKMLATKAAAPRQ